MLILFQLESNHKNQILIKTGSNIPDIDSSNLLERKRKNFSSFLRTLPERCSITYRCLLERGGSREEAEDVIFTVDLIGFD